MLLPLSVAKLPDAIALTVPWYCHSRLAHVDVRSAPACAERSAARRVAHLGRGAHWLVDELPREGRLPHQPRPALVVSEHVRNRVTDDLIVVPIFSEGTDGPTHVRLPRGAGGIRRDGVLFCEEITTLDRDSLARGPWGRPVDPDVLGAVVRAARRALGDVVVES